MGVVELRAAALAVAATLAAAAPASGAFTASAHRPMGAASAAAVFAPRAATLPVIAGEAEAGRVMTATTGGWERQPERLDVRWQRCGPDGQCAAIAGAATTSYMPAPADVGSRLRVEVTATNEGGSAVAVSAPTAVVAPARPAPTPDEAYLAAVRRDAPAALYDFEGGDARDASGHGRHATQARAAFGAPGALGGSSAVRLNGADAYLSLPWSPTCGVAGFTYEAWVFWETGRGYERIFEFGDVAGGNLIGLTPRFRAAGQLWGVVWVGGTAFDVPAGPVLATQAWKHVALTYDDARRMTIYVDGVARTSATLPWRPADVGCRQSNWIGRSLFAADPYFGGLQDDIAIYDRALTAAQLRAHHDARAAGGS